MNASIFEFLKVLFLSKIILLVVALVPVEIQHIHDGRSATPIAEHKYAAVAH